jgi:acyl carrier protein
MPPNFPSSAECTQSLEKSVLDAIRENLLPEIPADFDVNGSLYEAGLDSMGIMQMVLILDERFACTILPTDLTRVNFSSASSLASLIRKTNSPPSDA